MDPGGWPLFKFRQSIIVSHLLIVIRNTINSDCDVFPECIRIFKNCLLFFSLVAWMNDLLTPKQDMMLLVLWPNCFSEEI